MTAPLTAGAATLDITPAHPCFLYGYPHVPRTSTGTHDPLLASALVLTSGDTSCAFLAADVIFVSKALTQRVRARIAQLTSLPEQSICLSATHTHSGPITVSYLSNENDPVVPPVDPEYLAQLEDALVQVAVQAYQQRQPAEVGFARADATGIGTCRHDPAGPSDLQVPLLLARATSDQRPIALMMICAMHPTVLHEDSTLFSADFPGFARRYLQRTLGQACPVIYHTGASGDQSPRHVTRANTFGEARRLGELLGAAVQTVLADLRSATDLPIRTAQRWIDLPPRLPPDVHTARQRAHDARQRLDTLSAQDAPRTQVRSAECDWFGAQETLSIAQAAAEGRLQPALRNSLPAEIQGFMIGPHPFIAWPGELFVEFALAVKRAFPDVSILTLANGELQGYIVTRQAVENHWYEAGNSLLQSPESGDLIVQATLRLLHELTNNAHA